MRTQSERVKGQNVLTRGIMVIGTLGIFNSYKLLWKRSVHALLTIEITIRLMSKVRMFLLEDSHWLCSDWGF